MKIVEKFLKYHNFLVNEIHIIKKLIFCLSTITFLIALKPIYYTVKNGDFTNRGRFVEKICYEKSEIPLFNYIDKNFIFETKKEKSDRETILIRGYIKNIDFFNILAISLQNTGITRKNFKIVLSDNLNICNSSSVYCEIFLKLGNDNFLENHIFLNYAPNSDLFFRTSDFFKQKHMLGLKNFFYNHNFKQTHNNLRITVKDTNEIDLLLSYFRCISNSDSFGFGGSYYFAYNSLCWPFETIFPFFVSVALYFLIDLLIEPHQILFPLYLLYLIFPFFSILCLKDKGLQMVINIAFFAAINFKIAFLFIFLVYCRTMYLTFFLTKIKKETIVSI